jgi:hypothetical protein
MASWMVQSGSPGRSRGLQGSSRQSHRHFGLAGDLNSGRKKVFFIGKRWGWRGSWCQMLVRPVDHLYRFWSLWMEARWVLWVGKGERTSLFGAGLFACLTELMQMKMFNIEVLRHGSDVMTWSWPVWNFPQCRNWERNECWTAGLRVEKAWELDTGLSFWPSCAAYQLCGTVHCLCICWIRASHSTFWWLCKCRGPTPLSGKLFSHRC